MRNRSFFKKSGVVLSLAAFLLLSCTRETDLIPEGRGEIVVYCVLTEENTQTLTLDVTDIAASADRAALDGADIELYDKTTEKGVGRFRKKGGNDWQLEYAAIPEHSYRLKVSIPGREEITATTKMPPKCNIVSHIEWFWPSHLQMGEEENMEYGVQFEISSLPDDAVWVKGLGYNFITRQHETVEWIASSLNNVDPFNISNAVFRAEDYLHVSILPDLQRLRERGSGFYQYVEGRPLHRNWLRIPPRAGAPREAADLPSGYFSIAGAFVLDREGSQAHQSGEDALCYVLFMSPSEEYDTFLKELYIEKQRQETDVSYASLFSRKNLYSNIQGGIGLFGSKTEQALEWNSYMKRMM